MNLITRDYNTDFAAGKVVELDLVENPNNKGEKIFTPFKLHCKQPSEYMLLSHDSISRFNQNACDVLSACISLKCGGNEFATIGAIYHALTGNSSARVDMAPSMKKMIADAVTTLMTITITVDMSKVCKKFRYNGKESLKFVENEQNRSHAKQSMTFSSIC